jgi:hypothetical protein
MITWQEMGTPHIPFRVTAFMFAIQTWTTKAPNSVVVSVYYITQMKGWLTLRNMSINIVFQHLVALYSFHVYVSVFLPQSETHKYGKSGIYQIKFLDYPLKYVGQTGRILHA